MQSDECSKLAAYCEKKLDLGSVTLPDHFHYQSLPLCVIDAVYSIGVRYASTENVVERYCEEFSIERVFDRQHGLPPVEHQESMQVFVERLRGHGVEYFVTGVFRNRQRTSSRNGILKGEAVLRFAEALLAHKVNYLQDVPRVLHSSELQTRIKEIPGQKSGVSLTYFFMLAGCGEFVKPDRMVLEFMEDAIGREVLAKQAQALAQGSCEILRKTHTGLTPRLLDTAMWQYQRSVRQANNSQQKLPCDKRDTGVEDHPFTTPSRQQGDKAMDKAKSLFTKYFGMPFPDALLPDCAVHPLGESGVLFGSESVTDHQVLTAHVEFLESAPSGYYMIGFWGYGANSYAFYYVRVDERRKIYLRLPYGGAYSDTEEEANDIRRFFEGYLEFEEIIRRKDASLLAYESMGCLPTWKITLPDGQVFECGYPSLLEQPFRQTFPALFEG